MKVMGGGTQLGRPVKIVRVRSAILRRTRGRQNSQGGGTDRAKKRKVRTLKGEGTELERLITHMRLRECALRAEDSSRFFKN